MTESFVNRLMRSSVDRAVQMQTRKAQKIADEHLYSSPTVRADVEAIVHAGRRMVTARLCPSTMGRVALRRSASSATISEEGADLAALDNRHLVTVDINDDVPLLAVLRAGAPAAVWAWPASVIALASAGATDVQVWRQLTDATGTVRVVDSPDDAIDGVTIVRRQGVIATGAAPGEAVTRLEAAEALARITLAHDPGRTHG